MGPRPASACRRPWPTSAFPSRRCAPSRASVAAAPSPREHEEGLVLFIEPNWRTRFRDSLDHERLRQRVLFKLDHFGHLDPRFTENLPRADQRSEFLLPVL